MFLMNRWYAAARSEELGRGLLARRLLDQPVLLYRTLAGEPAAIEDRCCHRNVPLSLGRLVEDRVECGYHGLQFDRQGCCVFVPGQESVPKAARIRSYALAERWGHVWIWMGDAAPDENLIPDFSLIGRPGWASTGECLPLACNYLLAIENLLDLSHITYVHARTIGTQDVARAPVVIEREAGGRVQVTRWMHGVPPPPMFQKLGLRGNIDRWQIATAAVPCYVWLEVGGAPAGQGAREGNRAGGIERWNLNCITPETEKTCHLFWTEVRNFGIDDPEVEKLIHSQLSATLAEDAVVLEAQQRLMDDMPDAKTVGIAFDVGANQFRRQLAELLKAQTGGSAR